MAVLKLYTEREGVILRQLTTPADDKAYFEAQNEDPEHISKFGNTVYPTTAKLKDARLKAGGRIWMGIWDGNTLVGKIDAKPHKDGSEAEVGYWLRPSATGKGNATLAVKTFTEYLKPRFSRVYAEVHVDNKPSLKVMERSGYLQVGTGDRDWGQVVVFEPTK